MQFNESITDNFKELLRQIYIKTGVSNYYDKADYDKKLRKKFGFEPDYNHDIIESCIFLLEDSGIAIENFEEFGLQGPTRYNNIGEKYLRLYGFLNSIWLQRSVAILLAEIFKLPIKQDIKDKLDKLQLVQFRNIAGSHTVDHFGKNYFRLAQHSIEGNGKSIQYIGKEGFEEIDLIDGLTQFKKVFNEIFKRLIEKLFDNKSKNYKTLKEILKMINHKMSGGMVSTLHNGKYLII